MKTYIKNVLFLGILSLQFSSTCFAGLTEHVNELVKVLNATDESVNNPDLRIDYLKALQQVLANGEFRFKMKGHDYILKNKSASMTTNIIETIDHEMHDERRVTASKKEYSIGDTLNLLEEMSQSPARTQYVHVSGSDPDLFRRVITSGTYDSAKWSATIDERDYSFTLALNTSLQGDKNLTRAYGGYYTENGPTENRLSFTFRLDFDPYK